MKQANFQAYATTVVHAPCPASCSSDISPSAIRSSPSVQHLGWRVVNVAKIRDERPLMVTSKDTYSYRWFLSAVHSVAARLRDDDTFAMGNRVVLLQPNSPAYLASFFGALLADAVVVPLPRDIDDDRLSYILESTSASHLLISEDVVQKRGQLFGDNLEQLVVGQAVGKWKSPRRVTWNAGNDWRRFFLHQGPRVSPRE